MTASLPLSDELIAEANAREFGGLDILVANAGIASSAPIEETSVELWDRNFDVLAQGYFLTSKCAWPLFVGMQEQGGTSVVFIGSKNAVAAAKNTSAYASTKSTGNMINVDAGNAQAFTR